MILQRICDETLTFIIVYCDWPGYVYYARNWRHSPVGRAFENRTLELPSNHHILEDSANPHAEYIMVPFKVNGHLTNQQRLFNTKLASARSIIEKGYALLKGEFRRLKFIDAEP